jgi:3-isopropylmalate dehydrogenase
MKKTIAVLAGDGIGPEVMAQTWRVLDQVAEKFGHQFVCQEALIGGAAYDACGSHCPDETLQACADADAILFGSVGGPISEQQSAKWANCEANSLLKLRKYFDLSVNIRPILVYPELASYCPLNQERIAGGLDFVIFRELTGGIYFGEHQQIEQADERVARDECVYGESQIRCIAHAAFQAAQQRGKKLCSVDKANVLATSKLWRAVMEDVAADYPDVELSHLLVDNCAMQVIVNPGQFDVIVTENMFGDIISDLASVLPGSLGLIPSASLNKDGLGLYEPSGGSAPDIAGKNTANPCAQILSAVMMLRYSFGMQAEADWIEQAIKQALQSGAVTADIAADTSQAVSTSQFVDAVLSF